MGGDHGLEFLVRDGFRQYLDIVAVEGPGGRRLRRVAGPGGVLRGVVGLGRVLSVLRGVVGPGRGLGVVDVVGHLGRLAVERFRAGLGESAAGRRLGDVVFGGFVDAVGFWRGGVRFNLEWSKFKLTG